MARALITHSFVTEALSDTPDSKRKTFINHGFNVVKWFTTELEYNLIIQEIQLVTCGREQRMCPEGQLQSVLLPLHTPEQLK